MKNYFFFLAVIVFFAFQCFNGGMNREKNGKTPYDYVNPFIGSGGDGHTFPGAVVPFGMVQLSPDTEVKNFKESYRWCAGYHYDDHSILGFSHTHFSGTGHADMGDILLMPTIGEVKMTPGQVFRSGFSHDRESAYPGYYQVFLIDQQINAELTATTRCGLHRYTFPQSEQVNMIIDLVSSIYNFDDKVARALMRIENDSTISGFRLTNGWAPNRFIYFVMQFSKPFIDYGFTREDAPTYGWKTPPATIIKKPEISGKKIKGFIKFVTAKGEQILVKVGISAVGIDGAWANLKQEIPDWDFDRIKNEARIAWEKELNKIVIEGNAREKEIFYTSVYHTAIAPATYMDVDRRYRGLDQNIHQAKDFTHYTIFSLWDTFRATHPLFTLINKDRVGDMIQTMLSHYEQSAFKLLPIWSFHANETWCMIGYHAVSVIADAYLKGIKNFDVDKVYEAMKKTATNRQYDGLGFYMDRGYIPIDQEEEAASKVLEYAYDDFAIAQMAGALDKEEDHKYFLNRALNYRNIFDPQTSFMRAKKSDGTWREPFDPLYSQYGGDYTEGNAWQYTWFVPHDVQGLINLMGGDDPFVDKLDQLFTIKTSDAKHFLVEDISGLIGQYAHGNEPSQHIAYLYNYAGKPWKTQEKINQIMNNLFDNTPDGICGNEDCGQMSAWYIFSSMGFYPVCPGNNVYVIGKPSLKKATLFLNEGKTFVIETKNMDQKNIYIQGVKLNGRELKRSFITHQEIINGGHLIFEMGNQANKNWASRPDEVPPSISPRK